MCAPSPPAAPDYTGAAKEQGAANKEAAIASAQLNNPNVVNPYGTQTYQENFDQAGFDKSQADYAAGLLPEAPNRNNFFNRPTLTQTLSPDQQALLDASNQTKLQLSNLAGQGATAAQGVIGRPVDFAGMPGISSTDITAGAPGLRSTDFTAGAPSLRSTDFTAGASALPGDASATRDKVISAMMSRVDTDTARARDDKHSALIAAGIRPGSEAYTREMDLIDRGYNDARQQAILAGGQEASRDFGLDLSRRNQTIGENTAMFGASETARRLATGEQAQMFGASQAARQQAIQEAISRFGLTSEQRRQLIGELLSQRQIPLNEITALMSGSQVSNPYSIPGYAQNANIAAAPIYQATSDRANYGSDLYNVQAQQAGNLQKGLFGLGAAGLTGAGAAAGGGKTLFSGFGL